MEALVKIRPILDTIGRLDMSSKIRENYIELVTNLGLKPTSAKSLSSVTSQKTSTEDSMKKGPESSGNCYIATMVYGSYDSPEVRVLRRFRDEVLKQSEIGRKLIQVYYKPGFPISSRANKLNFVRINSMDAVQSSLIVLIWNTQWVKEKRML